MSYPFDKIDPATALRIADDLEVQLRDVPSPHPDWEAYRAGLARLRAWLQAAPAGAKLREVGDGTSPHARFR